MLHSFRSVTRGLGANFRLLAPTALVGRFGTSCTVFTEKYNLQYFGRHLEMCYN